MSMRAGDKICPNDIPEAIEKHITESFSQYGTAQRSYLTVKQLVEKALSTGNINKYHDIENGGAVTEYPIKPYVVLELIYNAMKETCRRGTVTYSTYVNVGFVNRLHYRPPTQTYTYSVIYPTNSNNWDTDKFCELVAGKTPPPRVSDNGTRKTVKDQAKFLEGQPIRVLDITDLLDKCNIYTKTVVKPISTNLGNISTCYYSCHINCHGSSRSRR